MQGGGNRGLAKSHQISIAWNGVSLLKRAGRSREAIISKQGGCRDPQSRRKDPAGHREAELVKSHGQLPLVDPDFRLSPPRRRSR
jgi:hypothetical protein